MPDPVTLNGPRLTLRPYTEADREDFAAMNADPRVMRYFPAALSRAESDAFMDRIGAHMAQHGYGFWALQRHGQAGLVGLCGLARIPWDIPWEAPSDPPVEIGWRLLKPFWRKGYTLEAARAALRFGFAERNLDEIVAFTLPANLPSQGVMERLGMRRDPADDFEHPSVEPGHPMRHHVLYRLRAAAWRRQQAAAGA